jgi:hypothetical protein
MKKLLILLIFIGVLIMFKNINAIINDSIGNIIYRGNVVTGIVATDNGDKSYDVFISESEKAYPKIFTLSANPVLAVGDKVRILYKNGCKELPIILPPTITTVIGDLIICDFEIHQIWRCNGISNTIKETLDTVIYNPSGACIANGNLITVGYVPSLDYELYICIHSGFSNVITGYFAPPGDFPSALAFDGTNLISCDWGTQKIYKHSGITASISSSFDSPSTLPRGLVVIGGNLISCDGTSDKVYFHSGISSTILSSFDCPDNPRSSYSTPAANGLTTDGTNLIMGDNGSYGVEDDVIFVFNGLTSTIKEVINAPAGCLRICGLTYLQ